MECFFKNPNYKFIDIQKWTNYSEVKYKLIIPKEEPKQEKEEEYFKHLEKDKKEFAKEWEEIRQEFGFGKKDTLEEAADKANGYKLYAKDTKAPIFNEGFIAGAKWQAEKMYSEQIELINWLQQSLTSKKFYSTDAEDLIEQFKKK